MPAWAQVAAALFVLGVSATIANLDVRYDRSGLTIRTGWSKPQACRARAGECRAVARRTHRARESAAFGDEGVAGRRDGGVCSGSRRP